MSKPSNFKQALAAISRLWDKEDYDAALSRVEDARKTWPGNAHLCILWASLLQLQEDPKHPLNDAKKALQQAMELDGSSPAGAIEFRHFLDAAEDDPQGAAKVYAGAVTATR